MRINGRANQAAFVIVLAIVTHVTGCAGESDRQTQDDDLLQTRTSKEAAGAIEQVVGEASGGAEEALLPNEDSIPVEKALPLCCTIETTGKQGIVKNGQCVIKPPGTQCTLDD